jgi:hypothetical protein
MKTSTPLFTLIGLAAFTFSSQLLLGCSGAAPGSRATLASLAESASETISGLGTWAFQLSNNNGSANGNASLEDYCNAVTVDTAGNIYCAGSTNGSLGEANGGNYDAFVMKISSSGTVQWIEQLGTSQAQGSKSASGDETVTSVAVDKSGNVYCAGSTSGALAEANGGNDDAFVAKLNSAGSVQWIRQLGATTAVPGANPSGWDTCNGVAVDASGNVYCAGSTTGGLGEANAGSLDAFILKLNSSGAIQWIRQLGASTVVAGGNKTSADVCNAVAVDASGNVFCGGYTAGSLGEANGGSYDAFIMKLNSAGTLQWVRQLGATAGSGINASGADYCSSLALDSAGNAFCGGSTTGSLADVAGGNGDAFGMKVSAAGVLQWVRQIGASAIVAGSDKSGTDSCNGIAVDASGSVYCAGSTTGSLGDIAGGNGDAFLLKLDQNGSMQWLKQFGQTTKASAGGDNSMFETFYSVALDGAGNAYAAGEACSAFAGQLGGSCDAILVKMNPNGAFTYH